MEPAWASHLTRDELIDHIDTFKHRPEFLAVRNEYLERAVHAKDLELIETLLDAGAGPDWVDETGETLMHHLSHEYQATKSTQGPTVLKIAALLLEHGADPNLIGAGNWRAMDRCIKYNIEEMKQLLLKFGADPIQREYV